MKPNNWNRLNHEQRRTIAVGLLNSSAGQGLLREALSVAAYFYDSAGQISKADDLVMMGAVLFPCVDSADLGTGGNS